METVSSAVSKFTLVKWFQSALHFTNYHFGTEMAHVCRCAVKPYYNQNLSWGRDSRRRASLFILELTCTGRSNWRLVARVRPGQYSLCRLFSSSRLSGQNVCIL